MSQRGSGGRAGRGRSHDGTRSRSKLSTVHRNRSTSWDSRDSRSRGSHQPDSRSRDSRPRGSRARDSRSRDSRPRRSRSRSRDSRVRGSHSRPRFRFPVATALTPARPFRAVHSHTPETVLLAPHVSTAGANRIELGRGQGTELMGRAEQPGARLERSMEQQQTGKQRSTLG